MKNNLASSLDLSTYYDARLPEYEKVYDKPERQEDLLYLHDKILAEAKGARLIEIACGTGYWTKTASESAMNITATDISQNALAFAHQKTYSCRVTFTRADAYSLNEFCDFSTALCMFFWSHVPLSRMDSFLQSVIRSVISGGSLVFADNRYVEGSSTKISRTDDNGNTYQRRKLKNEHEYEVLKNFPTALTIQKMLLPYCNSIDIIERKYYWCVKAMIR